LLGWLAGIGTGTWMAFTLSFKSATYVLHLFGMAVPCYAAVAALAVNLAVGLILSFLFNAASRGTRPDETLAEDYL
jgi:SSS family solute:Na+ symporter